ncbi:MAG: phosphoribosyltransferase [Bacteroidia bacterium]|nr:phosphoribosyltransferase [Bacteroidia bacterium]
MKYPSSIDKEIQIVKEIVSDWPVEVDFNNVIKWILQFDTEDFEIPLRIIKYLNVVGYDDLNNALTVAYSKLERMANEKGTKITNKNTLFAGIGDGGKSGAMISYNFRLTNELSEENFLDDESIIFIEEGRIENIVLVDDIVGTGNQAVKEINKLAESVIPLGVKNIFLLTAIGMKEGIRKVEKETSAFIFSAFEYDSIDSVSSLDSVFYEGIEHEQRSILKERIEYYGKSVSKSPLGYGGLGLLITFYYNTPNSTLPVIWSSLNSWIPLFKRVRKINGIASYYRQIDGAKPKRKTRKDSKELILFVEGKTDEIFFELLSPRIKEELGVEKINVISLGGGYRSEKLIKNLEKFSISTYIYVIEKDERSIGYMEISKEYLKNSPFIEAPILAKYFDLVKVWNDEEYRRAFHRLRLKEIELTEESMPEFERHFLRGLPMSMRQRYLEKLIIKYPNIEEIDNLIQLIKEKFIEIKTPPNKS